LHFNITIMDKKPVKTELLKLKLFYESSIKEMKRIVDSIDMVLRLIEKDNDLPESLDSLPSEIFNQVLNNESFPDFPYESFVLDKIKYYEDQTQRVFTVKDFKLFIEKVEGKKRADKTLNFVNQKINQLIRKAQMICLKYNGSNKYAYYTSRKDWIEIISNRGKNFKAQIKPGHEPHPEKLLKLSNEQKSTEKITWSGLVPA
jgi:hypothetical protein